MSTKRNIFESGVEISVLEMHAFSIRIELPLFVYLNNISEQLEIQKQLS